MQQRAESGEQREPSASIQREVIAIHKQAFGRGPVRSKLYIHEDTVLVLMFEGHTSSEETLLHAGERRAVAQTRVDLSESVRQRFIDVVERHLDRKVVGFMSSSQQDPDLLSHVYVLEPTDLLTVVEDQDADAAES